MKTNKSIEFNKGQIKITATKEHNFCLTILNGGFN